MRSVIAFAFLVVATSSTWAATVNGLQGVVLVNTGNGFQPVPGTTQAGPGARVVVNQGGQASVTYENGCTVTVNPGQLYTIAAVPPNCTPAGGVDGLAVGAAIVAGTVGGVILLNGLNSASP